MQRFHFILLCLTALLVFMTACAHYPLGMSEAEWNRLSSEQQLEARREQAALDQQQALERERKRQEQSAREAEEARRQEERDIAQGMIRRFGPVCIGGSRCPEGRHKEHIYTLNQFVMVDKVVFTANDNVGNKHDATVALYADNTLVADNLDIKRNGDTHTIFVGRVARNLIVRIRRDDEVVIKTLKVFGEPLNAKDARIILQYQQDIK